jgi:drug/metabolite transporter (DMT)-like permease
MYLEVISKILSESLLSLYPVFVKNIDLPLHLQLWSRFITYIVITGFFVDWGFIAKSLFSKNGLLLSFVTIIHVYTSYRGFQLLESGIAYSLFYTYPLMILLVAGEPINALMFLAIIGVILLSNELSSSPKSNIKEGITEESEKTQSKTLDNTPMFPYEGYVMIALAAATEAIIYFIVRAIETTNNWNHLFLSYFAGTFLFSFIGIQDIAKITLTSTLSISLFINAIIGLCGYLLRFYATTRLSPAIYAPLSYIGIVMAYVYGLAFNQEQITIQKVIGTICILAAIFKRKL